MSVNDVTLYSDSKRSPWWEGISDDDLRSSSQMIVDHKITVTAHQMFAKMALSGNKCVRKFEASVAMDDEQLTDVETLISTLYGRKIYEQVDEEGDPVVKMFVWNEGFLIMSAVDVEKCVQCSDGLYDVSVSLITTSIDDVKNLGKIMTRDDGDEDRKLD